MQLSNKQTDPAIVFVENERRNYETQWAMWNVEPVAKTSNSKNQKLQLFFGKKLSGRKILV